MTSRKFSPIFRRPLATTPPDIWTWWLQVAPQCSSSLLREALLVRISGIYEEITHAKKFPWMNIDKIMTTTSWSTFFYLDSVCSTRISSRRQEMMPQHLRLAEHSEQETVLTAVPILEALSRILASFLLLHECSWTVIRRQRQATTGQVEILQRTQKVPRGKTID